MTKPGRTPHVKRHPAEVTADRLAEFLERHGDRLDGSERDVISRARWILMGTVDGAR